MTDMRKKVRSRGYYPYLTNPDEIQELEKDPSKVSAIFLQEVLKVVQQWMEIAEKKLAGTGMKVYCCPGNDDMDEVDDIIQESRSVVVPVWWEPELTGLVHAWAKGASWGEVIAATSLDEGDVVRVLRRTVDLLAQIPYCEAVSQQLRDNARRALKAINRFPVCELEDLVPTPAEPAP